MKFKLVVLFLFSLFPAVCLLTGCPTPVVDPVDPPSGAPADLAVIARSDTSIVLGWSAVPDATTYAIYQASTIDGLYSSVVTGTTGLTAIVSGLSPATAYYFKVSAQNGGGEGPLSPPVEGTTENSGAGPTEGRDAFNQDYKECMIALVAAISADPLEKAGTKTYRVNGVNGGSAALALTKSIDIGTLAGSFTEVFSWSDYRGSFNTTINGSVTVNRASVAGTLTFVFAQKEGTVTFSGVNQSAGSMTGTYVITFEGETYRFDLATGAAL
jgi:chitodextrinase